MKNDFESLSEAWQAQPLLTVYNPKELQRKVFFKSLNLLLMSLAELAILAVVVWFLADAFSQSRELHIKIGLFFAILSGLLATAVSFKSRFSSIQLLSSSTQDWIELEKKMSIEALRRVKFAGYLMVAFCIFLTFFLTYEIVFLNYSIRDLALRYSFSAFWLVAVWLFNKHQTKKHKRFLSALT